MVEVEAKLPLTDSDARGRSKFALQKLQERDSLILERKTVANEYKSRIDALTCEATKLLTEAGEGLEVRTVKAREMKDFEKSVIQYIYKGQVIHTRALTLVDRQAEIPVKGIAAPAPKVSAIQDTPETKAQVEANLKKAVKEHKLNKASGAIDGTTGPRGPRLVKTHDPVADAHAEVDAVRRADLASVIKEETSAKTKWSQTDGAR